jgi:hypothetical protein
MGQPQHIQFAINENNGSPSYQIASKGLASFLLRSSSLNLNLKGVFLAFNLILIG